jgi:hypothetical protein
VSSTLHIVDPSYCRPFTSSTCPIIDPFCRRPSILSNLHIVDTPSLSTLFPIILLFYLPSFPSPSLPSAVPSIRRPFHPPSLPSTVPSIHRPFRPLSLPFIVTSIVLPVHCCSFPSSIPSISLPSHRPSFPSSCLPIAPLSFYLPIVVAPSSRSRSFFPESSLLPRVVPSSRSRPFFPELSLLLFLPSLPFHLISLICLTLFFSVLLIRDTLYNCCLTCLLYSSPTAPSLFLRRSSLHGNCPALLDFPHLYSAKKTALVDITILLILGAWNPRTGLEKVDISNTGWRPHEIDVVMSHRTCFRLLRARLQHNDSALAPRQLICKAIIFTRKASPFCLAQEIGKHWWKATCEKSRRCMDELDNCQVVSALALERAQKYYGGHRTSLGSGTASGACESKNSSDENLPPVQHFRALPCMLTRNSILRVSTTERSTSHLARQAHMKNGESGSASTTVHIEVYVELQKIQLQLPFCNYTQSGRANSLDRAEFIRQRQASASHKN